MDLKKILADKPPLRTIPGISCKRHPIVYCSLPKSGCTTIKNLMYYMDNGVRYPDPLGIHADPDALLWAKSADQDAYVQALKRRKIVFTFVREPFARAYSAFNEKIFHQYAYSFPRFRNLLIMEYGAVFPDPGRPYSIPLHADNFMRFLTFVQDGMREGARVKWDPHWAPQSQLIGMFRRYIDIDLIGRLECFAPAMTYVARMGQVSGEIDFSARLNEGPKPPYTLQQIMTPGIYTLLSDIYKEDLANFGYGGA